ncbi:hypothetical protein GON09_004445 [Rhodococcus sp. B50]|nr:hypothetical protein [Rhodococcus sp. B50]
MDFRGSTEFSRAEPRLAYPATRANPASARTTPVVGDPYSGRRFTPLALDCLLNAIPYFVSTESAQMREELLVS